MNLKESFRYQNFLDGLMRASSVYAAMADHCLQETLTHHMHDANPEVEDKVEIVEPAEKFVESDKILQFMELLIEEKQKLTDAIGVAKSKIPFDVESAIATNKYRQMLHGTVKSMIAKKPGKSIRKGNSYKFNAEGNQMTYYYDIEVSTSDRYDRETAKKIMREQISKADKVSAEIDAAMINTQVDYNPPWDVNDTYDEIVSAL